MTTEREYDCIVIGAGVHGSFTAYQLAKRNKKTLLLEQVRLAKLCCRSFLLWFVLFCF